MRLRSRILASGAATLLLVDLAGCEMNPGGPSAPPAPSAPAKSPGPDASSGVDAKGKKKVPGQKAKSALSSAAGTE
jgi:hypothetical protein